MLPINLLVIGDVHIADHSPGRRAEGYKQHILDKLYECVDLAKEKRATHVLFLGDIFHLKTASRVSHRVVHDMAQVFESFGIPVFILVGNHDITDYSLDSLPKQPLGILEYVPNVTLLKTDRFELDEDVHIYPIPGTSGVTLDDFNITGSNKRDILVVHQSIVPDIGKEREDLHDIFLDAAAVAERTDINIVLYGHQHRSDGMYRITRDNGVPAIFSNLGSICRLTIDDNDVYKVPSVLFLSIADDKERTVKPEIVKLASVLPANEAYKLEEHFEEKTRSVDIEETIRKLQDVEVSSHSIEGVVKDVEYRKDIDPRVKECALSLLEAVR
jgi:UDP-2,3-diacylglucosamine pyrophosphatase LpxH